MMTNDDGRVELIKKLLAKASASGTTPEERESFSAKAQELMIKWGIEDALLANADRLTVEKIIAIEYQTDCPASYSYEVTGIGIEIAKALGCRGVLQPSGRSRINLLVIGFESDVQRVAQLFTVLAHQVELDLAYNVSHFYEIHKYEWSSLTGTSKYRFRKSFIHGFAIGIRDKMTLMKKTATEEAGPGTELVLVDRGQRVKSWIDENMAVTKSRARQYTVGGFDRGHAAGMQADVGGTKIGSGRGQIGGA